MIHNAWAEMGANAKLFYDAFRGLCRMRINYAKVLVEDWENSYNTRSVKYETMQHQVLFWTNVYQYWEKKLKLSYQWEKDYFGPEKPLEITTAEKLDVTVSI